MMNQKPTENNEPEPLVDAVKVAEFLDVEPRTVMELARAGTIPRVKLTAKTIRFRISEVATAIEGGGLQPS